MGDGGAFGGGEAGGESMMANPKKPGDLCPKCGAQVRLRPNMFALRGQMFSGLVCCGALWADESQETIFDAAGRAAKEADK